MSLCNVDVVKRIGKYLNTPVGSLCYNTDKVLTTVLNKENVEGFASIVLRLTEQSAVKMSIEQTLQCYQWLEYIAVFSNQAAINPTFARNFLLEINKALEKNSYLTGQFMTVADIAAYHVLYSLMERMSVGEREAVINVCRWSRHIQAQQAACAGRRPLPLDTLSLATLAPAAH